MVQTFNDLYLQTRRALRAAGVESCELEARLLLCHAAGCSKEELLSSLSMYAGETMQRQLKEYVRRRLEGEPVAYITGSWEFCGLPIAVSPQVLIPRMDTEVLVEKAVETLRGRKMDARILDLGCGSGCIACAVGHFLPAARLTLIDVSEEALEIARRNVQLTNLSRRAVCVQADMLSAPPVRLGNFDMLLSNPPYIRSDEVDTLDPSVRDYEPRLALDGGEDGYRFYRSILSSWLSVLSDRGSVIMEVGEGQSDTVREMMERAGLRSTGAVRDTAGTERVVYGNK